MAQSSLRRRGCSWPIHAAEQGDHKTKDGHSQVQCSKSMLPCRQKIDSKPGVKGHKGARNECNHPSPLPSAGRVAVQRDTLLLCGVGDLGLAPDVTHAHGQQDQSADDGGGDGVSHAGYASTSFCRRTRHSMASCAMIGMAAFPVSYRIICLRVRPITGASRSWLRPSNLRFFLNSSGFIKRQCQKKNDPSSKKGLAYTVAWVHYGGEIN